MASEIVALERSPAGGGFSQAFIFLYAIPPASLIEIGGTGTTGEYPVMTPAPTDVTSPLYLVLTQAERDALDAGTSVTKGYSATFLAGASDASVLAQAQAAYTALAAGAVAAYTDRYKYIGRRFDKES